jgi:hypothetical protein
MATEVCAAPAPGANARKANAVAMNAIISFRMNVSTAGPRQWFNVGMSNERVANDVFPPLTHRLLVLYDPRCAFGSHGRESSSR